jgi:hypothetical protein
MEAKPQTYSGPDFRPGRSPDQPKKVTTSTLGGEWNESLSAKKPEWITRHVPIN